MGYEILDGFNEIGYRSAVLFCNTTDFAFGRLFQSKHHARSFLEFIYKKYGHADPRRLSNQEFDALYTEHLVAIMLEAWRRPDEWKGEEPGSENEFWKSVEHKWRKPRGGEG